MSPPFSIQRKILTELTERNTKKRGGPQDFSRRVCVLVCLARGEALGAIRHFKARRRSCRPLRSQLICLRRSPRELRQHSSAVVSGRRSPRLQVSTRPSSAKLRVERRFWSR